MKQKKLFWIDLEMTGLDPQNDAILEVAIIVTDLNFKLIEEYEKVVFQPQEVLEKMNEWCQKAHKKSGLTEKVKTGTSLAQIEKEVLEIIERHYKKTARVVLCGNSVGVDKGFIDASMPLVAQRLHYRIVDVSSFKEIFRDKFNVKFKKKSTHRALDDVKESIEELKMYLNLVKPSKS